MNLFFFLFNIALIVFIAALLAITPMLNRRSLLFGVRVPEAAAGLPECRRLKKNYLNITAVGCLIVLALAVAQYIALPKLSLLAMMYLPLVTVAVQFAAFIPQWKKARELKQKNGWDVPMTAVMETRSAADREKWTAMPWGWYIVSALLSAATAVWTAALYPGLPDRMITHWDAAMQPNAWADKNWLTVMIMPLIALAFVAIMAAVNLMIYKQKLQINAESPALSFAQHRIYRRMMGNAMGFMTLCLTVMFVLFQPATLNIYTPPAAYIPIVVAVTCIVGMIPVVYAPIKAGQSGCKLKPTVSLQDELSEQLTAKVKIAHPGRGDDQYWKLGMFYYNKDDPAVLIENRFGGKTGFNYARVPSKIFLAVIAAVLVVSYAVVTVIFIRYPIAW